MSKKQSKSIKALDAANKSQIEQLNIMKKALSVRDNYSNPMLQQGQYTYDPINGANYTANRMITWDMLRINNIERSESIICKGVKYKATMPLIKGVDIKSSEITAEDVVKLQKQLSKLTKPLSSIIYQGEMYGGAAGLIYINGQTSVTQLLKPLDVSAIKKGDFLGIKPLERWFSCNPSGDIIKELGKSTGIYDAELLGEPLYFNVRLSPSSPTLKVHRTRLIFYNTGMLPDIEKRIEQFWGVSTIERIWTQLYNYNTATREAVRALNGLNIRVVKLEDLTSDYGEISDSTRELLEAKLNTMKAGLNNAGMLFLGGEDEFDYKYASLSEVSAILKEVKTDLANNFEVPYSYLFGDGTLTSQINENEFTSIKQIQEWFIRPWFEKLLPIIYRHLFGKDIPEYTISFKKIRDVSDKDIAEVISKVGNVVLDSYKVGAMPKESLIKSLSEITSNTSDVFNNVDEEYINEVKGETYNQDQVKLASALNKGQVVSAEEQRGGDNNEKKDVAPKDKVGEMN